MASRAVMKSSLGSKSEIPSLPNKKVPQNPRYKNVGRKIDTGSSISSYMQKMEQTQACYKYKKDEIFKRIKCTTFCQLIIQVAEEYFSGKESEEQRPEVIPEEGDNMTSPPLDSSPVPNTERRTLSELVTGTGDLDSIDPPNISSPSQTQSSLPNQQQPVSYFIYTLNGIYLLVSVTI
eukprot:TRINITY_DN3195_c0_g3_i3.p1 TRINITY_DN3195_c0_g3~~TRINITY_DN3195_c0_g3_i3.p1  ORF type:complete len:194 (+),score=44.67 TRINITY_DN3195_c0_g3_i3:50-583(+)